MPITQILKAVLITLINAVNVTGAGSTFALPNNLVSLVWQTAFDTAPSGVSITLEVSLDNVNWTTIDTSTATIGEVRTITNSTSAAFIRANVGTNTGNKHVTVTLIAKPINQ